MNLLQRALIEKAGHDDGFEHVVSIATDSGVALTSVEVIVQAQANGFAARLSRGQPSVPGAARHLPDLALHRAQCGWLKE